MELEIGGRKVGWGHPVVICAEIGGNARTFGDARRLIEWAAAAGADAIKLQTLAPDYITLDSDKPWFRIKWGERERTLYGLYRETAMPWGWQPRLKEFAEDLGLLLWSTPFCHGAVDFLEEMAVPCYKIASFEITDLPLIGYVASKGKPLIISTGMATEEDIDLALAAASLGLQDRVAVAANRCLMPPARVILLQCISAYPANPGDANLRTMAAMAECWHRLVGLSDHTLSLAVPVTAVALGACLIEKHLTLDRSQGGPDAKFSLEPTEFGKMVQAVREAEAALGEIRFGPTAEEAPMLPYRRSLFAVDDIEAGEPFTARNIRSIRPACGLAPRHYEAVLGRRASQFIERGTPLTWGLVE
ncbi:MAG: pseudaminic acid synthase [Gaiellales bacterium]|nr:MAG: pseudaminic acid synthase [Gaiellales bacterium]